MKSFSLPLALLAMLLLNSCATLPPELQGTAAPLTPSQVLAHPENHFGQTVRWGGTILKLENGAKETRVQILARPLDRSGHPTAGDYPVGRFLARTPAFLDPAVYAPGRELTIVGTLVGVTEVTVGQRKIQIPVVEARRWHLWPKPKPTAPIVYPYWWYDFWWFYYPWAPYCCW